LRRTHLILVVVALIWTCAGGGLVHAQEADPYAVFEHIDLTRPDLAAVKAAVDAGDRPAAAAALKAYYQQRVEPHFIDDRHSRPAPNPDYNTAGAERVLRREYTCVGKPATLTHDIDWSSDPFNDFEWPTELNRHGSWSTLARAYWATHDEKYAEDLCYQIDDWIRDNPRPEQRGQLRWAWSTLQCGIRLGGPWPESFFRVIDSEQMTPELLCRMLEVFWQQCDYLLTFHGGGNWLVTERSGLQTTAIVFPEFKDADAWQANAWSTLSAELTNQVLPDGAQVELTPHYHSVTLGSFLTAYTIAGRNNVPAPDDYLKQLERMYEYLLYVAKPDGQIPMLNDSDDMSVKSRMRDGATRFGREDMRYMATGSEEGEPPDHTSHAFKWAGQYVMRTGWHFDNVYLLMDAGPFGFGHQHEDKLGLDVWAYGNDLIVDPGRFTYAGGKWRSYFVSTLSHSAAYLDGQSQRRRQRTPRDQYVSREPLDNLWFTDDVIDFSCGSYEEGYDGADNVIHIRKVLFIKRDYSIITDLFVPTDGGTTEHTATVQYQLARPDATVDEQALQVVSGGEGGNVLIKPVDPAGCTMTVLKGEEDPPAGWVAWSLHRAEKEACPMVRYSVTQALPIRFDTIIVPWVAEGPPNWSVKRLPVTSGGAAVPAHEATALEITHPDGLRDEVFISHTTQRRALEVGEYELDPELDISVIRYDGERITGSASLWGPFQRHQPAEPVDAVEVDGEQPFIDVRTERPATFLMRYGYADGGGYLFETPPSEPGTEARLRIQNPRYGLGYGYVVIAEFDDGAQAIQRGTILVPEPRAFNFDDGTLQGFGGSNVRLAPGRNGSPGCLSVEEPPTKDIRYAGADFARGFEATDRLKLRFAYCMPMADGGKYFYAKVTLRDDAGLDWSAYFAKAPVQDWTEVELGLGDFRGDTKDKPEQRGVIPAGTKIVGMRLTLRKDETPDAVAPVLQLDDFEMEY
jgi:hypothetical protein